MVGTLIRRSSVVSTWLHRAWRMVLLALGDLKNKYKLFTGYTYYRVNFKA